MIDSKKIDDLLNEKKEYLIVKTKDEIKKYSNEDDKSNIIGFNLSIEDFNLIIDKKSIVYFAIYDTSSKKYLTFESYIINDFKNGIFFKEKSVIVQEVNKFINFKANLEFKFLVVPIINENKGYLSNLEKYFYKPNFSSITGDYEEIVKIIKKILYISFFIVFPFILIFLTPIYIYTYLIDKMGFINNLIDIYTISTSLTYLLVSTFNYLLEYIFYLTIAFIILIYFSIVITLGCITFLIKILYFFKFCSKDIKLFNNIKSERIFQDVKSFLKLGFNYKYYYMSILLAITYFSIVAHLFFIFSLKNNHDKGSFITLSSKYYLEYSAFPKLMKIQVNDKIDEDFKEEIVMFMGSKEGYSYYYNIDDIKEIIKKNNNEENRKKLDKKNITFKNIYSEFIIGNIDKEIKIIKDDMYKIYNLSNEQEYILNELLDKKI
ncbi:hypothetical protein CRU92_12640 [Arcobacter sp. FW59]|nr:hypothetical protein CRU92_12640 [Arcobacter sp. FW59]